MSSTRFTTVWEFRVPGDSRFAFEQTYGPGGSWVRLFRLSPEYLGTELLYDIDHIGRYMTLDHWASREAAHQFKQDHHAEYSALDRQCESLTEREVFLGDFQDMPTSTL